MIDALRSNGGAVLLLDCGGIFSDNTDKDIILKADVSLTCMNRMKYDALNLGGSGLLLGEKFMSDMAEKASFPLISSNLSCTSPEKTAWFKPYVLRKVGSKTVAILGIMPTDALPMISRPESFNITPPAEAVEKLLPEVRKQADVVILISQAGFRATAAMLAGMKKMPDLIVVNDAGPSEEVLKIGKTPVLSTGNLGKVMGVAQITAGKKKISVISNELVSLDQDVPSDESIVSFVDDEITRVERERNKKQEEITRKQLQEGLKLSPEEFFKQYNQTVKSPKP